MKWQRPALLWTAVLAAGLGLWAGYRLAPTPAAPAAAPAASPAALATPALQVGDPLPALTLPDLEGRPLDLRQRFAGRPLLINVWASWCAPCVEEMPELARFAHTRGSEGVQVLGLALDTPEDVRRFLQQVPVDYPIVIETRARAMPACSWAIRRDCCPTACCSTHRGDCRRRSWDRSPTARSTAG